MSAATSSPPSIENLSRNLSAFNGQINNGDHFVSNPSNGEEELSLNSRGDSVTVNLSVLEIHCPSDHLSRKDFNTHSLSVSPINCPPLDASTDDPTYPQPNTNPASNIYSPASHQDFLSPSGYADNGYSDLSCYGSPEVDEPFFLEPEFGLHLEFEQSTLSVSNSFQRHPPQHTGPVKLRNERSLETTTSASQLLSPVLTNTPSPPFTVQNLDYTGMGDAKDMAYRPSRLDIPAHRFQQTPTLTTTSPCSDTLEVNSVFHGDRATSPIVKVSSYTRGDSPSRPDGPVSQRPGKRGRTVLSSSHLAPSDNGHEHEDESDDHYFSLHYKSISVPASSLRADDGSWIANPSTGQSGLEPASRGDAYVPTIKEMEEQRRRDQKNADVELWLSVSEANSEVEDNSNPGRRSRRRHKSITLRRRARSTGDPSGTDWHIFDDSNIPGPGVLLDENTGLEDTDDDTDADSSVSVPESPPASMGVIAPVELDNTDPFPPAKDIEVQHREPLPRQFIRARPWQDPPNNSRFGNTNHQPPSSNAAVMRFLSASQNIETASRTATWGTRRLSESDASSLPRGSFNSFSSDKEKKHTRRGSILDHASKLLLPKRSNSSAKRKLAESVQQQPSTESVDKAKIKDSRDGGISASLLPQRKPSFTRSTKSPLITGNAVLAMTGHIAAVSGRSPVGVSSPNSSSTPWNNFMRRSRSKSDLTKCSRSPASGGLVALMTTYGGPPVPTLASPLQDITPSPKSRRCLNEDEDEDDENEAMGDKGVAMDFTVRADPIVPTLEGFKTQIQQLNPRLLPVLVERIAQEQVRRYKKLVELKVQHNQAVRMQKCSAGKHCFDQGGDATMLPPRISSKDPDSTCTQFQVLGSADPDVNFSSFGESAVTAALFPPAVPLPPVKRLPAQFECSLCFKVKTFQKPSDWTKHVHEDVMPFTCTFPKCTEPKSFKRKADWVRHESERHRQLEWWTCSIPDCSHTCYRKDNFVQHLVREHKMPEPKVKTSRGRGNGNGKQPHNQKFLASEQGLDHVWKLVEECHHTTTKQPKDEACRFCGNVCNSWKKLSVHMAKHMEQIAMPVLALVTQRTASADTIISPIYIGNHTTQRQPGVAHPPTSPLPGGGTHYSHSFQSDQVTAANIDHSAFYNSVPQNSELYAAAQSPLLSGHLHPHNDHTAVPKGMGGRSALDGGLNYSLSPYSQISQTRSPSPHGRPITTDGHHQLSPHFASTPYPPPYNAMSRRDDVSLPDTTQAPVVSATYGLDISANVSVSTAYDNHQQQQQMYASPIENLGYVYQQGQDPIDQSGGLHYTEAPAGMRYLEMSGPSDGAADLTEGYPMQPNSGQSQCQNQ
ncbi:hypothetical protein GX48_01293 [Paracoccidioides brasiliensis]|nr:hypothetical protein GX48_01293 [Paracoccidioides brasiliensis]